MAVIVKLSRKVYDRLGDDVVGELVDWFNEMDLSSHASLRELNELNFSRFDSKLEQRLADFRADVAKDRGEALASVASKAELTAAIEGQKQDMAAGFALTKAELTAAIEGQKQDMAAGFAVTKAELTAAMTDMAAGFALTKAELTAAMTEMAAGFALTQAGMTAAIEGQKKDMAAGFALTKAETTAAIETSKADLLKWMVVMWVATLVAPFLAASMR